MIYTYSLLSFILYYFLINLYETFKIYSNKYKHIFEYTIIYETKYLFEFEPLYLILFCFPFYIQHIIMIMFIIYTFTEIYKIYHLNTNTNIIIIKTYRSIFGILFSLNTMINYYAFNHIFLSFMNMIALYFMINTYKSRVYKSIDCNS